MIVVTQEAPTRRLYTQTDFPAHEFIARRAELAQAIGPGATAVLAGASLVGGFDLFRQSNDMFYLSGVETPHAYLRVEGGSGRSVLYLPAINAKLERSDGPQMSAEDAALAIRMTGCDDVRPQSELGPDLAEARVIYTPHSLAECRQACRDSLKHVWHAIEADPWDQRPTPEARFRERLRGIAPGAEIRDLSPLLDRQRMVKNPSEIRLMRRAGYLSTLAVTEAMRATRPGVMEYQLAAIGEYVYLVNGAEGASYRPIVACGANIWNAHYYRNNCPLTEGDLVLMDCAPDYGYYTSDIGRYWPVNGTYSPEQRQMYGFIVEYHKALLARIRPGVTSAQILGEAAAVMEPAISATRWLRPSFEKAARETLKFAGHLSHTVGMAVHDVGDYRGAPLEPGTVFALDPQMWVPEEQLYYRVEDTVVVTHDGVENLTVAAPLELDDVERTMREQGVMELARGWYVDKPMMHRIQVVDSHTGGEPTRVVVSGGPDLGTGDLAARRDRFRETFDEFRSAIVNEPRGSDAMVGAMLVPSVDPTSAAGVIFFNNVGYLGMCVHGTIGLVVTLAHLGRISAGKHRLETPVGTITAQLDPDGRVTVRNVLSYRTHKAVRVQVEGHGEISGDVAWGGNWFFLTDHAGLELKLSNVEALTDFAWRIRQALARQGIRGRDGGEIDHVELFGPPAGAADSRNFVLCPGKAYDRSPCGTGTSAKIACLAADGKLAPGQPWRQESILGSTFEGFFEREGDMIVPLVSGTAHVNAEATLLLDEADPFRMGIRG